MANVQLPNLWSPRHYQMDLMRYLFAQDGTMRLGARAVEVWHRRCGKDSASLQLQALATQARVGTYWTMLPTLTQARRVIWDGIDRDGRRMIDQAFPKEIRSGINHSEMKIEFKNGSVWQCVGSDNYDSLVGTNPIGVVFSEYSIADPRAWDFIRPILSENDGFAIFIYTPRGKNHGYDLYQVALGNEKWHCSLHTIDDTFRDAARTVPVISAQAYQDEIDGGMDPQLAQQEYYCSFDAGLFGAYYTDQLKKAKLGDFPWNPMKPVYTSWDLGLKDATSIFFFQETVIGGPINVIEYWEESNVALTEWYRRIKEMPYSYGAHMAPHDIKKRDADYGVRSVDTALEHGIDFEECPNISRKSGIEAVKSFIPRLQFDKTLASRGWDALVNYRREYNDKLRVFMDRPLHDWASNGADSMRYAAIGYSLGFQENQSSTFSVITAAGKRSKIGSYKR